MSPSHRSKKPALMGNHQRSWIWGRHAVMEAVRSERWFPLEVRVSDQIEEKTRRELEDWHLRCSEHASIDQPPLLEFEPSKRLEQLCHQTDHQGFIARMPAYPYLSASELLENLASETFLLVLDGIQDAFNFGACLRCAEVFGVDAVLIGTKGQTGVNSQVVRSSAGAVHHVPIVREDNFTATISELKAAGVTIVAASEKAEQELPHTVLRDAVAMIIGNESQGIAPERLELASCSARIPQAGSLQSLNAAVATGIFLYEGYRQRHFNSEQKGIDG